MAATLLHTAQLAPATRRSARLLLDEAFGSDFADADWEHVLGGLHALVHDGDRLVAHGAVVQRRLVHGGRALRIGYVEGGAVADGHRRRGHASAVMAALEELVRRQMAGAAELSVPLEVSVGFGASWDAAAH